MPCSKPIKLPLPAANPRTLNRASFFLPTATRVYPQANKGQLLAIQPRYNGRITFLLNCLTSSGTNKNEGR